MLFSKIKLAFCIVLFVAFFDYSFAQTTFVVHDRVLYPDMSVRIGESVQFANITIKIGRAISAPSFTVGITNDRKRAHFIISKRLNAEYRINAGERVPYAD